LSFQFKVGNSFNTTLEPRVDFGDIFIALRTQGRQELRAQDRHADPLPRDAEHGAIHYARYEGGREGEQRAGVLVRGICSSLHLNSILMHMHNTHSYPGPAAMYEYDLFAVINHEGQINNGHYTNYARFEDEVCLTPSQPSCLR
jgi:hypothetical protein